MEIADIDAGDARYRGLLDRDLGILTGTAKAEWRMSIRAFRQYCNSKIRRTADRDSDSEKRLFSSRGIYWPWRHEVAVGSYFSAPGQGTQPTHASRDARQIDEPPCSGPAQRFSPVNYRRHTA